jgi:hypothetical protein
VFCTRVNRGPLAIHTNYTGFLPAHVSMVTVNCDPSRSPATQFARFPSGSVACHYIFYYWVLAVDVVRRTGVPICVTVKERQDGPEYQKNACCVDWSIALFKVLVMTNELHLGEWYESCHYSSYGTVIVLTVFRFCIETEYARANTPLSCVAL